MASLLDGNTGYLTFSIIPSLITSVCLSRRVWPDTANVGSCSVFAKARCWSLISSYGKESLSAASRKSLWPPLNKTSMLAVPD